MTTGAIEQVYHVAIWDPILASTLYLSPTLAILLNALFLLATFSVNVFANTVGPAYDFANTFPRKLTWFRGSVDRDRSFNSAWCVDVLRLGIRLPI